MSHKIIDKVLDVALKTYEGLDLKIGAYKLVSTNSNNQVKEHAIIYKGNIATPKKPILLRMNSACFTGDIFHCNRCDCTWQLLEAMKMISKKGGLILYSFSHEGRGVGLVGKLKTYDIMDKHNKTTRDAFEEAGYVPDMRDFSSSVFILKDLGIKSVKLLSNNPDKKEHLIKNGIEVTEMISLVDRKKSLRSYLLSKKLQFGHKINLKRIIKSKRAA